MTLATEISTPVATSARADGSCHRRLYWLTRWIDMAIRMAIRRHERRRQCKAVLQLDDRMLADIGVTRSQAFEQAKQSYWKWNLLQEPGDDIRKRSRNV